MLLSKDEVSRIKQTKPSRICPHIGEPCPYAPKLKRSSSKEKKLDAWGRPIPAVNGPKLMGNKYDWGKIMAWIRTHPEWKAGCDWAYVDEHGESRKKPSILYYSYYGGRNGRRKWCWTLGRRIDEVKHSTLPGFREYANFQEWDSSYANKGGKA